MSHATILHMHRTDLLQALANYAPISSEEEQILSHFRDFVENTPTCFERSHPAGHVTGSAFLLSPDRKKILLTFHAKLKRWLQLGGHADGHPLVHEVALREAEEESGISKVRLLQQQPFDFDIHEVPANAKEAAHLHYDVRYLVIAEEEHFVCSHESLDLKWIPLDQVSSYTDEHSLLRTLRKL